MFFRRERARVYTPQERLDQLRTLGFQVTPLAGGGFRVGRAELAVDMKEEAGELRSMGRAGVLLHGEIAALVDGGYQKFFSTTAGRKRPALADDLKQLHDFEEDLKEALGQKSLYNESLGTVSTLYLYDRVKDRDRGVAKRVWE